jgi:hypothetical protein
MLLLNFRPKALKKQLYKKRMFYPLEAQMYVKGTKIKCIRKEFIQYD